MSDQTERLPVSRLNMKEEMERQHYYMDMLRNENEQYRAENGCRKAASVRNFGCQMNEHDSEKLSGMLSRMGYVLTAEDDKADVVVLNTCCVRENAEEKIFGHLGAWKGRKRQRPGMVLAVCGCMTEQPHIVETINKKYKQVDLVFGTRNLHRFPELLYRCLHDNVPVYQVSQTEGDVAEGVPIQRDSPYKAWVTVMYGCDNFCSYCIVPYVRGRERSRLPEDILQEVRELDRQGVKEITLLGQNVNSYGKDLAVPYNFAGLLSLLCQETNIPRIRFMTSHPKDLSPELIDVIARYPALCKQLHLPVQSGSTEILRRMNRRYSREYYLSLVQMVREKIPDIVLSTDVIVGFPGEREEDFQDTLDLMRTVRFDMAFTFLYSRRTGTPAASYEDQIPEAVMKERFDRLLELQNSIGRDCNEFYLGQSIPVLCEGVSRTNENRYTGRTEGNKVVNFTSRTDVTGQIVPVRIRQIQTWSLEGELDLSKELSGCGDKPAGV